MGKGEDEFNYIRDERPVRNQQAPAPIPRNQQDNDIRGDVLDIDDQTLDLVGYQEKFDDFIYTLSDIANNNVASDFKQKTSSYIFFIENPVDDIKANIREELKEVKSRLADLDGISFKAVIREEKKTREGEVVIVVLITFFAGNGDSINTESIYGILLKKAKDVLNENFTNKSKFIENCILNELVKSNKYKEILLEKKLYCNL